MISWPGKVKQSNNTNGTPSWKDKFWILKYILQNHYESYGPILESIHPQFSENLTCLEAEKLFCNIRWIFCMSNLGVTSQLWLLNLTSRNILSRLTFSELSTVTYLHTYWRLYREISCRRESVLYVSKFTINSF